MVNIPRAAANSCACARASSPSSQPTWKEARNQRVHGGHWSVASGVHRHRPLPGRRSSGDTVGGNARHAAPSRYHAGCRESRRHRGRRRSGNTGVERDASAGEIPHHPGTSPGRGRRKASKIRGIPEQGHSEEPGPGPGEHPKGEAVRTRENSRRRSIPQAGSSPRRTAKSPPERSARTAEIRHGDSWESEDERPATPRGSKGQGDLLGRSIRAAAVRRGRSDRRQQSPRIPCRTPSSRGAGPAGRGRGFARRLPIRSPDSGVCCEQVSSDRKQSIPGGTGFQELGLQGTACGHHPTPSGPSDCRPFPAGATGASAGN